MTIDPKFIDQLKAHVEAQLTPEDRKQIASDSNQMESIRAVKMLHTAIRLCNDAPNLADEIKRQIFAEHIMVLREAIVLETVADIIEGLLKAAKEKMSLPDAALALVADGMKRGDRASRLQRKAAETVLQNLADLYPQMSADLTKGSPNV